MASAYSGLVGAFRFAFRETDSWALRSYVLASAFIGGFVAIILVLALVTWIANPTGRVGERVFLGFIALIVLAPLFSPVLIVARRHRLGHPRTHFDRVWAVVGYAFVASLYLGLFISDPRDHAVPGPVATAGQWLDALPDRYGLVPPIVGLLLIAVAIWATRARSGD